MAKRVREDCSKYGYPESWHNGWLKLPRPSFQAYRSAMEYIQSRMHRDEVSKTAALTNDPPGSPFDEPLSLAEAGDE